MARRGGIVRAFVRAHRESERLARQRLREQQALLRQAERSRRAVERAQIANQREQARLYAESRAAEADASTNEVRGSIDKLERLLNDALQTDSFLDFERMKEPLETPKFEPGRLAMPETAPLAVRYMPPPLSFLQSLVPGAARRHLELTEQGQQRYSAAMEEHERRESERLAQLEGAKRQHETQIEELKAKVDLQHREVDGLRERFDHGERDAISAYFDGVLGLSEYPEGFPLRWRLAFVPESKQLVIEYQLPTSDVVPEASSYKHIKSKDEIVATARPASQQRSIYASVVAQVALRTLHEVFKADRTGNVETVIFNDHVQTIDRATGQSINPCLVTVRATRELFQHLDLARVEPIACLQGLHASVSKSPAELVPVRPVLEFDMVDPRFIEKADVLSTLDQRPNLMDLTPGEFEALITNLFEKMGLETRLTQPSRDGGVDCVAYDPRPIFGGKVVIQAKRYKHTVGVSAVRDLFGTMQNEGASKGILVTTSGYGKAAFEFAAGKPLELLSGSNLLYLLVQHAGLEAKIEVPEDWKDPVPDSTNEDEADVTVQCDRAEAPKES